GRNTFPPPFKVAFTLAQEARVVHVGQGQSELYTANQRVTLGPGDTLIMKVDNFVNSWQKGEEDRYCQVIVFELSAPLLHHLYGQQWPSWFSPQGHASIQAMEKVEASPVLNGYFTQLCTYLDHPGTLTEDMIALKAKELVSLLAQAQLGGVVPKIFGDLFTTRDYEFESVIQQHLYEPLSLEDLAFLTGLSLSSFKRKFAARYGSSPTKYMITKRLEKAHLLLETSAMRITEIAYACGFSEVGHFSKTFRSHYQLAPTEVRKRSDASE
ncbi:MAG TPA: hypothetical protein DCE41_01930, partial [Cytophagales bacterium]|nr:hypothetical protein [Cytophagales bacterium]